MTTTPSTAGVELRGPAVARSEEVLTPAALEFVARLHREFNTTREKLLQEVWGYDTVIDTWMVDTHMRRLREKLGVAAKYLDTVRGVGYRFVRPVTSTT